MVKGCDGIVYMGGQSVEAPWGIICRANIDGMVNLYEAARKHGVKRIEFASSNHAIGFYRQTELLDAGSPTRPDGLYGVSKIFGEALASMYHDNFGIETACIRIGSCFPEPADHRMLSTWMSHDDFTCLIECTFTVRKLGYLIIYGVSDNDATWWDNRKVSYLGWRPRESPRNSGVDWTNEWIRRIQMMHVRSTRAELSRSMSSKRTETGPCGIFGRQEQRV